MENHPIPQDITGFQFKLIGDMTIKQFAYLASGVILGWVLYASPLPFFIKFPFIAISAGMGAGFAFLPIAGRPMDVMVFNFIKALFVPNQYVFQKVGGKVAIFSMTAMTLPSSAQVQVTSLDDILAKTKSARPANKLDEKELVFFQNLSAMAAPAPVIQPYTPQPAPVASPVSSQPTQPQPSQTPQPSAPPSPTPAPEQAEQKLAEEAATLQHELQEAKQAEQAANEQTASLAHQKSEDLERQLKEIMAQKAELENQLVTMSQKLQVSTQKVFSPSEAQPAPEATVNVRKVSNDMGAKVGLPIAPETPNLIVGIVKDPRGNILPNILVEVRDAEGNPVRAFKTNQLGQFAAATPLLNGTYTLAFEDPAAGHTFDVVQIEAAGEIISPLEVISTDARELLRKDLFG